MTSPSDRSGTSVLRKTLRALGAVVRGRPTSGGTGPDKPVLHLLHIRKTGGTAVKHALRAHAPERYNVRLRGHRVRLADVPAGERVMFFLRDPVSRFVSGFYDRQREGRPRYDRPWTAGEATAFGRFATPNALALALSSSDVEERGAAERAMSEIRHVRQPLARWLGDRAYLESRLPDVFFVGFQERLAEDFERLKRELGLPEHVRLPSDEVSTHQNPGGLDRRLDEAAVRNLTARYAQDYELIEVCRAHAERINGADA